MSVRELQSMHGGRKQLQSNADEVTSKRSKTINNDSDDGGNDEEHAEQPVKKAATQARPRRGKNPGSLLYTYEQLLSWFTTIQ